MQHEVADADHADNLIVAFHRQVVNTLLHHVQQRIEPKGMVWDFLHRSRHNGCHGNATVKTGGHNFLAKILVGDDSHQFSARIVNQDRPDLQFRHTLGGLLNCL